MYSNWVTIATIGAVCKCMLCLEDLLEDQETAVLCVADVEIVATIDCDSSRLAKLGWLDELIAIIQLVKEFTIIGEDHDTTSVHVSNKDQIKRADAQARGVCEMHGSNVGDESSVGMKLLHIKFSVTDKEHAFRVHAHTSRCSTLGAANEVVEGEVKRENLDAIVADLRNIHFTFAVHSNANGCVKLFLSLSLATNSSNESALDIKLLNAVVADVSHQEMVEVRSEGHTVGIEELAFS